MSFTASRVAVTDTATLVYGSGDGGTAIAVRNIGSVDAYVGGSGVTDTAGFLLEDGEVMHLSALAATDDLFAICAAGLSTDLALLVKD